MYMLVNCNDPFDCFSDQLERPNLTLKIGALPYLACRHAEMCGPGSVFRHRRGESLVALSIVSLLPHLSYGSLGVRMLTRTFQSNGQRVLRQLPIVRHACGPRPYATTTTTTPTDSPAGAVGLADPTAYCRDLVRKHDYESFLLSHFYPKQKQDAYFAIKAFSVSIRVPHRFWSVTFNQPRYGCVQVELATVRDNVSNTMIGQMRMQFWRDALKQISAVRVRVEVQAHTY